MAKDKKQDFQTDWNQSMATHMRLDKLFMACHLALDSEDWSTLYKTLYSLYAESSSVLNEEEEESIREGLQKIKCFVGADSDNYSAWEKVEGFTMCQVEIRNALQSHGMMIQQRQELGPAGRS